MSQNQRPKNFTYDKCKVNRCANKVYRKGFCKKHYTIICLKNQDEEALDKMCYFLDCANNVYKNGYCRKHYNEVFNLPDELEYSICKVEDCNELAFLKGYCRKHYTELYTKVPIDLFEKNFDEEELNKLFEGKKEKVKDTCSVKFCTNLVKAKGLCSLHYQQSLIRFGITTKEKGKRVRLCVEENCSNKHYAKGYCRKHYLQYRPNNSKYYKDLKKKGIQPILKKTAHEAARKRTCNINGCSEPHYAQDYCSRHYHRLLKETKRCSVEGCNRLYAAKGYCAMHYQRMRAHGRTDKPVKPIRRNCSRAVKTSQT